MVMDTNVFRAFLTGLLPIDDTALVSAIVTCRLDKMHDPKP